MRRRRLWAVLGVVAIGSAAWIWPRPRPDRLLETARAQLQAGRDGPAEATLDRLARLRAPTPADRLVRGQVAWVRGRDEDALGELAGVPDGDPGSAFAHLLSGQIDERRSRLRAAEVHYRAALAAEATVIPARRRLAYLFLLQHRLREFDEQYRAVSDAHQLDDRSLAIWSRVHSGIWDASSDLDALEKAVEADPDDRPSRLALAEAHLRGNRPAEAGRVLSPLPDNDPEARALRVSIALARGDTSHAESLLAGGPSDHPDLARLRGNQALARGDAAGAAEEFRIVLKAEPGDRASLFGLGMALKTLGDPAGAGPFLERARRHDHLATLVERIVRREGLDEPQIRARLGDACESAGRLDEARAWYRSAIARDPLDEASQRALYRLEQRG